MNHLPKLAAVVLVVGVLYMVVSSKPPVRAKAHQAVVVESSAAASVAPEVADESPAAARPTWTFAGRVGDVLRETPVADAVVTFQNAMLAGVGTYKTKTDFSGNFQIDVPSLGPTPELQFAQRLDQRGAIEVTR